MADTLITNSKILIVDDDYSSRLLLEKIIRTNITANVLDADEGSRALRLMVKEKPDLVVLDLEMPFMDGFEVLKTMSENSQLDQIKVIVCTASSDMETVKKIMQYGIMDFLVKPIDKNLLINKVENLLKENV